MYRSRDETGIDLVTVSDLRRIYEAALARREPLPISVSVGVHPIEILSAAFKAPPGVSEMTIAGGLHGAPVRLRVETLLGYKMVKYLTEVIYLPERTGGFWEDQGYEWFAGV